MSFGHQFCQREGIMAEHIDMSVAKRGEACDIFLERTNEGRQEAKLKGIKFGRRRTVDRNVVLTLHQKGTGATEIAHQLSIARSTVYKILEDERAS